MPRIQARIGLALFALLLAACLTAIGSPGAHAGESDSSVAPAGQTDLLMYQAIVDGVRNGARYYDAVAEAHRAAQHPLKPVSAVRLPVLAVVQAALPALLVDMLLLALCLGTMVAWVRRLRPELTGLVPVGLAGLLVLAGLWIDASPSLAAIHEVWAGPLIALSLALSRPGQWISAVALGLSAMLIRETAVLYVVIMAVIAWAEGARREALGWLGAIAIFAVTLAAHAHALSLVTGPLDFAAQDWSGFEGFGFYVKLATVSSGLEVLPQWLASLLLATALFGWLAWRDPTATRVLATLVGYAASIAVFARVDDAYAALITTPLLLVGLVLAVDGLRDLIAAASDTRRITVTRVIR